MSVGGQSMIINGSELRKMVACLAFSFIIIYFSIQSTVKYLRDDEEFILYDVINKTFNPSKFPSLKEEKKMINPKIPIELASNIKGGFIFGRQDKIIALKPANLDGHIGIFGGSGLGKTTCIAIPSIRGWQGPVFAIDIKGELSDTAEGYRKNMKIFDPANRTSYGFDPFYFVDLDPGNEVTNIKKIAYSLIKKSQANADPFWVTASRNLLTGELLYFYNLGYGFIEAMESIQRNSQKFIVEAIMASNDELAKSYIGQFESACQNDNTTFDGIVIQLMNDLKIFDTDPMVRDSLTREKIITPQDLENGADIFIRIPEGNLEVWAPMLNLITSLFLKAFESRNQGGNNILMLLDEFPRMGEISGIENALATLRSRKITIAIFVQSLSQLDNIYGQNGRKSIVDNFRYKAVLGVEEQSTQEYFSKAVGTYNHVEYTESRSNDNYGVNFTGRKNQSYTIREKRIIKPEEFGHLGDDLVMLTTYGYFKVKKIPYYIL